MTLLNAVQNHPTLFHNARSTPRLVGFSPTGSYYDEVPALNPPRQDLVQHLQGIPTAPVPQEQPPTPLGTLSRYFLEKLAERPPARHAAVQKLHRKLLLHTGSTHDPGNLDKQQAKACYQYFKAAQQAFDELARTGDQSRRNEYREQGDLCRMLKWQYRASRDQRDKSVLDEAMVKSRAAVAKGGALGNHTSLGVGVGTLGMASLVPNVKLSTELSTTQGRIIKDTTRISAGVTAKLSTPIASAEVAASFEKSTTRKYGSIDDYADARSRSKWTWWNGSRRDMLTQSRNLFASCNHYKRNIRLAAQSQPYLERKLQENGLGLPGFEQHQPKARPFQIERGERFALTGSVRFDGLGVVTLGAAARAQVLHTTKNQALDIIELYDWSPELAKRRLDRAHTCNITGRQLISDLEEHIASSSEQLTSAVLNNLDTRQQRRLTERLDSRSRELADQYVYLKSRDGLADGSEHDTTFRQLFSKHAMLLRPDSLKLYTARADTRVTSFDAEAQLKGALVASAQAAVKLSLSSVRDDDPHLSGTYLDITLDGQVNTLESLQGLVATALSQAGASGFDPAPVVALIAGTALYQAHGVSARFSLKIKDGKPTLLLSQQFLTQTDNVNQTIDTPTPLTLEIGFGGHLDTLHREQLGSQSLDLLLPLALAKLGKRTQTGIAWWDRYVDRHADAFDNLLNNMANDRENTLIHRELANIRSRIGVQKRPCVDSLVQAAREARDNPGEQTLLQAREALKEMFFAYIDDYYDARVKSAWRVE